MAHDVIPLGAVPSGESAAQVGESGYAEVAFLQCTRYIALLRHTGGPEDAGARLRIRRAEADVDPYLDVVVEYDAENSVARAYAIRCDREAPPRWESATGSRAR